MHPRLPALCAALSLAAFVAFACADNPRNPSSPTAIQPPSSVGSEHDSTLKATAPSPISPVNDALLETRKPTLTVSNAQGRFAAATFTYRFQVFKEGQLRYERAGVPQGSDSTSHEVTEELGVDEQFVWRARAELEGAAGPWSAGASFSTPKRLEGYFRDNELFDPLTNSRTVGIANNVVFEPGRGARLVDHFSYIRYNLRRTLTRGEHSMVIEGVGSGNAGDKTKLLFHLEDDGSDPTSNDRRLSIDHRGRHHPDPGVLRIRILTHDDDVDSERLYPRLRDENTYYVKMTWGDGRLTLRINEGNDDRGRVVLDSSMRYGGVYDPSPHAAFVGGPIGRNGPIDASIPGMIVRNVYIGEGPRPQTLGSALVPDWR